MKTLEVQNKSLSDDIARQKVSLQQIRAQDAIERRKRDQQILRMKEKAGFDVRRIKTMSVVTGSFSSSHWLSESASSVSHFSENSESASVFREAAANVIPDLMQELTDENARLIALIRETALMLNIFTGEKAVSDSEFETVLEYIPTTFPELSIEVNNSLEQLRELLHEPKYVSVDEVAERDQDIERLKKQLADMTKNWEEAIQTMDEWNQLMEKNMGGSPRKSLSDARLEKPDKAETISPLPSPKTDLAAAPAIPKPELKLQQDSPVPPPPAVSEITKMTKKIQGPQRRVLPVPSRSRIPGLSQIRPIRQRPGGAPLYKSEKQDPQPLENDPVRVTIEEKGLDEPALIPETDEMPNPDIESADKQVEIAKSPIVLAIQDEVSAEDATPSRYPWSMLSEVTNRAASRSPSKDIAQVSQQTTPLPKSISPAKNGTPFSRTSFRSTQTPIEEQSPSVHTPTSLMTPREVVTASASPSRRILYPGHTPAPINHDEDEELAAALRIDRKNHATPKTTSKRPIINPVSTLGPARRRTLPKTIMQLSSSPMGLSPMGLSPIKLTDVDPTGTQQKENFLPASFASLKRSREEEDDESVR